ncbi:hypothetical protein [Thauera sp. SDU_THAU2]|uniref:hypothetical protein n=1 Tax=Thauera sp. SDU_THAU2 TaxID=3136633 RepID=UPI00311DC998
MIKPEFESIAASLPEMTASELESQAKTVANELISLISNDADLRDHYVFKEENELGFRDDYSKFLHRRFVIIPD